MTYSTRNYEHICTQVGFILVVLPKFTERQDTTIIQSRMLAF